MNEDHQSGPGRFDSCPASRARQAAHGDGSGLLLALFDAYSLALAGRTDEAIGQVEAAATAGAGATDGAASALAFLAKARLLLDHADARARRDAVTILEKLAARSGEVAALARLELARVARREGRPAAAAKLIDRLEQTVTESDAPDGWSLLPLLVARERGALERQQAAGTAARPATTEVGPGPALPDAASLLRLIEFGKTLAGQTDPQQVLEIVLQEAIRFADCERGFVALATGEQIEFALAESIDCTEIDSPHSQISRTLIKEVLDSGRPLCLGAGLAVDSHPAGASLVEIGIPFAVCVPIGSMGATVGALYLDRSSPPQNVSADLPRLLGLFSSLAATSLENAWLHQTRDRELQVAREALHHHRSESERRLGFGELVGASDAMQQIYRQLERIIPTDFPVLIRGETGSGKDTVARLIHARGPRQDAGFVAVSCAGVPDSLLEDELFGHERGAFSGADRARPGLLEVADGGTLFLDEVGEMSPRMQAALLRVLESGEVRRLGANNTTDVDVRIITATHRDLEQAIVAGSFRGDLFFRLNVLHLTLPPLRERSEDLPLLVAELTRRFAGEKPAVQLSERAMRELAARHWPGNVRELNNLLKRLTVVYTGTIEPEQIPPEVGMLPAATPLRGTLREIEGQAVRQALAATGGNRTRAARLLGISRRTLYAKLRRLGEE